VLTRVSGPSRRESREAGRAGRLQRSCQLRGDRIDYVELPAHSRSERDRATGYVEDEASVGRPGDDLGLDAGKESAGAQVFERSSVNLDLLGDPRQAHERTRGGLRQRVLQLTCLWRPWDRVAVRARRRVAQDLGKARLYLVRDDVLPTASLDVSLGPRQADDVDEEALCKTVLAND
jgi:hypothetical protein